MLCANMHKKKQQALPLSLIYTKKDKFVSLLNKNNNHLVFFIHKSGFDIFLSAFLLPKK